MSTITESPLPAFSCFVPVGEILRRYEFPVPLPTVNYALASHWRIAKRIRDEVKQWAGWVIKTDSSPISGCVGLRYTGFYNKLNHDADNMWSKAVSDSLVKFGVLPSDNANVIREVIHRIERSMDGKECTVLEIYRELPPMDKPKKARARK